MGENSGEDVDDEVEVEVKNVDIFEMGGKGKNWMMQKNQSSGGKPEQRVRQKDSTSKGNLPTEADVLRYEFLWEKGRSCQRRKGKWCSWWQ